MVHKHRAAVNRLHIQSPDKLSWIAKKSRTHACKLTQPATKVPMLQYFSIPFVIPCLSSRDLWSCYCCALRVRILTHVGDPPLWRAKMRTPSVLGHFGAEWVVACRLSSGFAEIPPKRLPLRRPVPMKLGSTACPVCWEEWYRCAVERDS